MRLAFNYFIDNQIHPMLETDYPFTSGAGDETKNCLYSASKAIDVNVKYLGSGGGVSSNKSRVQKQPVSTGIAANNKYIHSYASGIIDANDCMSEEQPYDDPLNPINHGVLIVGYGHDEATGLDYWLLKNSWNTTWGDKGYFKVAIKSTDEYLGFCGV